MRLFSFWFVVWLLGLSFMSAAQADEPPESSELRVMTWNVLADPVEPSARAAAIAQHIELFKPDVVTLQEVAPWFLADPNIQRALAGYAAPRNERAEIVAYRGVLVLVRGDIAAHAVIQAPSEQRRLILQVEADIQGQRWRIVSCHLDSPLESGPMRALQMHALFEALKGSERVFVTGDFNFGDGEAEEAVIPSEYKDAWRVIHASDAGFTWDIQNNPMAVVGSFPGEPSRRLDRILIKAPD